MLGRYNRRLGIFEKKNSQLGGVDPENSLVSLTMSKPLAYALACTINVYVVPG